VFDHQGETNPFFIPKMIASFFGAYAISMGGVGTLVSKSVSLSWVSPEVSSRTNGRLYFSNTFCPKALPASSKENKNNLVSLKGV
ncbi:MAG: hypothetical protein ACPGAA_06210, partial [Flavobacteriaceae bacterium]